MSVVVVGNPKLRSRTRLAGELVVEAVTGSPPDTVIELSEIGPGLLGWGDPTVAAAKAAVLAAGDLLVVATPTYKATYTGLLKLFLDQFGAGELAGQVTVPLMLGGGLQHALAPELTLRPVLVEIGASCPWPALYLLDTEIEGSPLLDAWLVRQRSTHVVAGR
ncbi:MAG: NAD(P)H-dependent oxidoreductase [Gordonia sp. (in: high G+C Gram-positive bacteria)]